MPKLTIRTISKCSYYRKAPTFKNQLHVNDIDSPKFEERINCWNKDDNISKSKAQANFHLTTKEPVAYGWGEYTLLSFS